MEFDPEIQTIRDERLLRIGAICEQWSFLEYLLIHAMSAIVEVEEDTGKILFGGLDIRPRMAMAIELARHLQAPQRLIDGLIEVRSAVEGGLLKRRNRVIHGVHFTYTDGDLEIETHRGKDRGRRRITATELQDLTEDIHAIGNTLADAINEGLWNKPRPPWTLLEKPARRSRRRKRPKPDQILKPPELPPQS